MTGIHEVCPSHCTIAVCLLTMWASHWALHNSLLNISAGSWRIYTGIICGSSPHEMCLTVLPLLGEKGLKWVRETEVTATCAKAEKSTTADTRNIYSVCFVLLKKCDWLHCLKSNFVPGSNFATFFYIKPLPLKWPLPFSVTRCLYITL